VKSPRNNWLKQYLPDLVICIAVSAQDIKITFSLCSRAL